MLCAVKGVATPIGLQVAPLSVDIKRLFEDADTSLPSGS